MSDENKKELIEVFDEIGMELQKIANSFKSVQASYLKEEAIYILLKARLPSVPKDHIIMVLKEAGNLAKNYLK